VSRRILHYVLLTAVMLAMSNLCFAAGGPVFLKSELTKPDKIWVGQRLDLNVTLFTTSAFAGVVRFDLPNDSGMVIVADDTHPLLGSETIEGSSYLFKQYTISLFPLSVGPQTIPSFRVEFGYRGDEGRKVEISLPTNAHPFTVLDVPGYDPELPLITAGDLKVDDRWEPKPGKATVGDAFLRTVTMTATGLPGMAFPPLAMKRIDGVAIYSRQPAVSTDTQRGAFTGKRVETYSYVCQRAGAYTLPEIEIQWWNPEGEVLQRVTLRSATFQVAPNPALESGTPPAAAEASGVPFPWRWAVAAALIVVIIVLLMLLRKKNSRSTPRDENKEKALFRQFRRAAESSDAPETMQTLMKWLDASGHAGGVSEFVRMVGEPELEHQLDALETSLYGKQEKRWSGKILYTTVADARPKFLRQRHVHPDRRYALGPLNP